MIEERYMNMEKKIYGYVRVSSKDQNESRQIEEMKALDIPTERIFLDKESGKDFNRPEYQTLKRMLKDSPNSLLIISSIDRLGRNYKEIVSEWKELTDVCNADIKVLDMPLLDTTQYKDLLGTFISDLILQVLSFVAEQERKNIKKRQADGIATAQAHNVRFGRPATEIPDNFRDVYDKWKNGEITATKAIAKSGLKRTNFYKIVKNYERGDKYDK